ncbi:MAG: 2-oxoglutarate dehydrogenase complex dihydrolipoyllysine-residue succinyltransferase [Verrucomicrobia bacterium]|nr:2-oxoglutarate dehydrogenase complex dihydrolipoyllysine-residue succinyltransferase [Verrucomicrobiota bacterium]MCH8510137.1 2-oxoglutarate dehydrogenase complex dihydrolipoyllysine-residue succinyltransferase [Kiritimatiellia bacterium]
MSIEIKTPELPESVDEATLLTWHFQSGDAVHRDDKIADVETDKIVLEVFAPADGVLKTLIDEGGTLKRGDKLATIREGSPTGSESDAEEDAEEDAKEKSEGREEKGEGKKSPSKKTSQTSKSSEDPDNLDVKPAATAEELKGLSPSVRKLMIEHNLHPNQIDGTGKDKRISREDVIRFIEETPVAKKNLGLGTPERTLDPSKAGAQLPKAKVEDTSVRRVPMSQLRRRVATRLKEVQNTAALLTTFNEINMKPVMDIRAKYKDRFEKDYGVKLGFMSFFVKATVEALKKYPIINAALDGNDILYHEAYHIGIAVDSPRGLVVPVLRNAETMSFAEVEKNIRELAGKAKEAKLAYEDLIGGTFTITNGGVFGSMLSTPIINAPQSAILGMHAIQERPWVENGEVVVRPVMYLALTYDHRIIDGRDAVQYLVSMKQSLEDPAQLMLQL